MEPKTTWIGGSPFKTSTKVKATRKPRTVTRPPISHAGKFDGMSVGSSITEPSDIIQRTYGALVKHISKRGIKAKASVICKSHQVDGVWHGVLRMVALDYMPPPKMPKRPCLEPRAMNFYSRAGMPAQKKEKTK